MPTGAATYTTYLRTELDPVSRQSYSQLRSIAASTYADIGRFASEASNTTAAAFGDKRSSSGFRSLDSAASSAFGSIRREAVTTAAAVSSLQQRLSSIRSTSLSGAVSGGASPAAASSTRAAAAANDNLSAANRRLSTTTAQVTTLQERQRLTSAALGSETTRTARGLEVLGTTLAVVQGPLGPVAGRISAITSAITTLGPATLLLAGAATALFAFAGVANTYAEVESRLKPLYSSQEQVNAALRETGRIALATRAGLAPTADLYAKLTAAGREFGISQREISRVTETAAKAATLSGGSAASREAGLYQFSQGLSSNKLGGDELKSILENIPELARAIAAGFKNVDGSIGVSAGELRKLGSEGKLTAQVVADALSRSADTIDAKFSKLPKTIGSAQTEFVTSFTLLTGQIDHTVGVTSTLANAISVAAQNLQTLIALGGALAARFILPKLGAFLAEQRTAIALQRELASGATTAAAAGNATLLTPTGIARGKALTESGDAAAAANQARDRVLAEQQVVAAIDQEFAATKATAEAERQASISAQVNAETEIATIEQKVAALRTELATRAEIKAAAAVVVDTSVRATPLVTRPLADGEQEATRTARVTAFTEAQTAAKLELAQADLRLSATARALSAAEAELAAATEAGTGAILTQTEAANASATRGFALLTLAESRAVATVAVTEATIAAAEADTVLAGAEVRLTAAQIAYNAAATLGTTVMSASKAAAGALSSALGGPVVIALTAVTGALIYMAGQTNAALDALHNFAGGQDELMRRLGLTTDKLKEQAGAARELAVALAQANVVKARTARIDANADLGSSLTAAAQQLSPGYSLGAGRLLAGDQQGKDIDALTQLGAQLKAGLALSPQGIQQINDIQKRNPGAFATSGVNGALLRFQGARPDDTSDKVLGTEAARLTLADAQKTLAEVKAEAAKPVTAVKPPAAPLTNDQLLAQGSALGSTINGAREIAKRRFDEAKARALADPNDTDQQKIDKIADATAAYNAQIQAIDKRDAAAARATSRREAAADAKAQREAAKATRERAEATEKLNDLRAKYDDQPKLVDSVRNDQRAFTALVGQKINVTDPNTGKTSIKQYTAADAVADSAKAEAALNKPFTDVTKEMERQQQISALQLEGRDAEADALQKSYSLIDRTGTLQAGQYATLVSLAETQNTINAALEERGRIVSTLRGSVDSLRESVTSFLDDLPNKAAKVGKQFTDSSGTTRRYGGADLIKDAVGGLSGNLLSNFSSQSNKLGVDSLFGGIQKKVDDLISGRTGLVNATTFTAQQTTRTGTIIQQFGDVISTVTDKVNTTIANMGSGNIGVIGQSGVASPFDGADARAIGASITAILGPASALSANARRAIGDNSEDGDGGYSGDIVVTGRREKPAASVAPSGPITLREIYNEQGKAIGSKIDEALGTKFVSKLGGKLGDVLGGAKTGVTASNIASALGLSQSGTGAALGGGLGGILSGIKGVTSALGPFGAALTPVLGILGGTLGKLFSKPKTGSATITNTDSDPVLSGNNSAAKKAASAAASSVQSSISSIADELGATIGNFAVSIGKKGDKYVVDTSGSGSTKYGKANDGITAYATEEEAVEAALRDAISDGAIKGISEASQRILQSGQDLQKALNKALLIESIPKKLLAYTDPVRAAVNDLNTEFQTVIDALNEGKATAAQYAQAQQLYDIERAKAIQEAQKAATSAIDDYLKNMTAGSSSPLNKATVYKNASTDLDKLATDVKAGKVVDSDDLTAAAQKFQDASRALYGSSSSYFNDFDTLKNLLEQAKTNAGTTTTSTGTDLPASPFDTTAVQAAIAGGSSATVKATQDQTDALSAKLDSLIDAVNAGSSGSGDSGYSSLNNLAAFRNALA